jgi:hypothetical protein
VAVRQILRPLTRWGIISDRRIRVAKMLDRAKRAAAELGARGGKARAAKMTPQRRTEIAKKAARRAGGRISGTYDYVQGTNGRGLNSGFATRSRLISDGAAPDSYFAAGSASRPAHHEIRSRSPPALRSMGRSTRTPGYVTEDAPPPGCVVGCNSAGMAPADSAAALPASSSPRAPSVEAARSGGSPRTARQAFPVAGDPTGRGAIGPDRGSGATQSNTVTPQAVPASKRRRQRNGRRFSGLASRSAVQRPCNRRFAPFARNPSQPSLIPAEPWDREWMRPSVEPVLPVRGSAQKNSCPINRQQLHSC